MVDGLLYGYVAFWARVLSGFDVFHLASRVEAAAARNVLVKGCFELRFGQVILACLAQRTRLKVRSQDEVLSLGAFHHTLR